MYFFIDNDHFVSDAILDLYNHISTLMANRQEPLEMSK